MTMKLTPTQKRILQHTEEEAQAQFGDRLIRPIEETKREVE